MLALLPSTKAVPTTDGVNTRTLIIKGVRQFTGTDRNRLLYGLYGRTIPTSGTPLGHCIFFLMMLAALQAGPMPGALEQHPWLYRSAARN